MDGNTWMTAYDAFRLVWEDVERMRRSKERHDATAGRREHWAVEEKARRDNPLARDGRENTRPVAAAPKGKRSAEEEMRRALMLDYRGAGKSRAR